MDASEGIGGRGQLVSWGHCESVAASVQGTAAPQHPARACDLHPLRSEGVWEEGLGVATPGRRAVGPRLS